MYGNMFGFNPYAAQISQPSAFSQPAIPLSTQPSLAPPAASPAFLQVGTAKEFDNVTIQPGRQALIMAQNDPYIAFKSADNMGMVTTNLYKLEPVTSDQINSLTTEYVTRQEFQQTIQQLIENITPKKTTAKKETTE